MPPSTDAPESALRGARPFASVEEAWFWTMAALVARRDGASHAWTPEKGARPCEPDDVVKCLDRLYRQRRIDLTHARILRIWGERQRAPDPRHPRERGAWRIWHEAMSRLEWPLRLRGIVVTPTPEGKTLVVMPARQHGEGTLCSLIAEAIARGLLTPHQGRDILSPKPAAVTTASTVVCD